MKKRKIFPALFCALIVNSLFAQTEKRQSVSVSYHPVTMAIVKNVSRNIEKWPSQIYETVFGDYGYKAVGYDARHYGAWEVEYKRYLSNLFRLNIGISCELSSKRWDLYDVADGPRIKRITDYRISLLPGIDCIYFEKRRTKLYLSGQVGGEWYHRGLNYFAGSRRNRLNVAWQAWAAINIRVRGLENLNTDFALGYGTLGIMKLCIMYAF